MSYTHAVAVHNGKLWISISNHLSYRLQEVCRLSAQYVSPNIIYIRLTYNISYRYERRHKVYQALWLTKLIMFLVSQILYSISSWYHQCVFYRLPKLSCTKWLTKYARLSGLPSHCLSSTYSTPANRVERRANLFIWWHRLAVAYAEQRGRQVGQISERV